MDRNLRWTNLDLNGIDTPLNAPNSRYLGRLKDDGRRPQETKGSRDDDTAMNDTTDNVPRNEPVAPVSYRNKVARTRTPTLNAYPASSSSLW